MRITNNPIPQLSTFLVPGEVIGDSRMGYGSNRQVPEITLQGEFALSAMPQMTVPRGGAGRQPFVPVPKEVGPMAISGGSVGMVPIAGDVFNPLDMIVDPVQRFLMAGLPLDSTGAWTAIMDEEIIIGAIGPEMPESLVAGACAFGSMPQVTIPRREIVDSGVFKKLTTVEMGGPYGQVIPPSPFKSSSAFTLTGITKTGAGVALANCRVVAMQTGWIYVDNAPVVIAETTSDGSGNFSMLLRNIDYQIYAYKAGSPDVAGVSRNDLTPVNATTVYLRDPTTADVGGGGGTTIYPFSG